MTHDVGAGDFDEEPTDAAAADRAALLAGAEDDDLDDLEVDLDDPEVAAALASLRASAGLSAPAVDVPTGRAPTSSDDLGDDLGGDLRANLGDELGDELGDDATFGHADLAAKLDLAGHAETDDGAADLGDEDDGAADLGEDDDAIPEALSEHAQAVAMALREAVLITLHELNRKEQVEINEDAFELVADELLVAAQEGRNPRHALKKLRAALIDSPNVEEVYADDRALESAFRRSLGG